MELDFNFFYKQKACLLITGTWLVIVQNVCTKSDKGCPV